MLYSTGSSAWSFLEGLNLLPALAEWLQVAVLSSDIFLQQFHEKWEYGFPTVFFQCSWSLTWKSCLLSIMKKPYQPNFLLFALLPTTGALLT